MKVFEMVKKLNSIGEYITMLYVNKIFVDNKTYKQLKKLSIKFEIDENKREELKKELLKHKPTFEIIEQFISKETCEPCKLLGIDDCDICLVQEILCMIKELKEVK